MYYGKNNIIIKLQNSIPPEYLIINPLTGSCDMMNDEEYELLGMLKTGCNDVGNNEFINYLLERGYLFLSKALEDKVVQEEFEKFNRELHDSQIQLLLVPTYRCNLACVYCYQRGIEDNESIISKETVDAFFNYAEKNFGRKKERPFITLFGGEPLISSPRQKQIITYILSRCRSDNYEIAVVSNGLDLVNYIDILADQKVKEIQITVDGCRETHDSRRATAGGKGSFDRIIAGLEEAISIGIPINFRTVADKQNMHSLVELAQFVENKGWLDLGNSLFKTQIGRNYELFDCYLNNGDLFSQVELWRQFVILSREYPILSKFHRPDFKGIRYLVEMGNLYPPSFDTCPAAKTEWVFDLYGDIYGCTATCGRKQFALGTYHPTVILNQKRVQEWQRRNVHNITDCQDCQHNLICGGGCGIMAANKTGKILTPDCRPIHQIIELGVNYYSEEIKLIASD